MQKSEEAEEGRGGNNKYMFLERYSINRIHGELWSIHCTRVQFVLTEAMTPSHVLVRGCPW